MTRKYKTLGERMDGQDTADVGLAKEKELFDMVLAVKARELKDALENGRFVRRIARIRARQKNGAFRVAERQRRAEESRERWEFRKLDGERRAKESNSGWKVEESGFI